VRKFAHIVNPVIVAEESDLFVAQPVTFQTMRIAQRFAVADGNVDVALYSAHFPEDAKLVPEGFIATPPLERSVLDVGTFRIPRKLPLLSDILMCLHAAANDAHYLIYTNVDIGLLPNFYVTIDRLIDAGHQAFTIHRRGIPAHYRSIADIPLMWAELDQPPQGRDCFVFCREALEHFELGAVCLGALHVGRLLMLNLAASEPTFAEFTNLHLTFHIGDAKTWANPALDDYGGHNLTALRNALDSLKRRGRLPAHPVVQRMIERMKANGELPPDY